jgi:predicted nucleic acid-binding Zn ribbon protein
MPIYVFQCPLCRTKTEMMRRMDQPFPSCTGKPGERHAATKVKKCVTAANFCLKGGGWAKDGYSK